VHGGYLVSSHDGLESVTSPGTMMADSLYRALIAAKGAAYLKRATDTAWWVYLNALGADCYVDTVAGAELEISPKTPGTIRYWIRHYILQNGYKPAGGKITFRMIREV